MRQLNRPSDQEALDLAKSRGWTFVTNDSVFPNTFGEFFTRRVLTLPTDIETHTSFLMQLEPKRIFRPKTPQRLPLSIYRLGEVRGHGPD